jgi:hypothetical protein
MYFCFAVKDFVKLNIKKNEKPLNPKENEKITLYQVLCRCIQYSNAGIKIRHGHFNDDAWV